MSGFSREPEAFLEASQQAASSVIASDRYVLGRNVAAFETAWALECGCNYGIGVANGMDAIEAVLRALSIGRGDEVITTPMTAFATILAIVRAGAVPVLADIDLGSGLLALDSVRAAVTVKTKAIVLVHLYGQMRDMEEWASLCAAENVALIEDCAQAHLAEYNGRRAGSWGEAGAFSFYPTKNLGAVGDAGAIVTSRDALAIDARKIRNYGQSDQYSHELVGMNSRLDELQASILLARLEWLRDFTERRREIARKYRQGLKNPSITLLDPPQFDEAHVYHQFVIRSPHRDQLRDHLARRDIETLIHYPTPIHRQLVAPQIDVEKFSLPRAEQFAGTCVSLPCHPQLTDEEVDDVISAVNEFTSL